MDVGNGVKVGVGVRVGVDVGNGVKVGVGVVIVSPDRRIFCVCVVMPSLKVKVIVVAWFPNIVGLKTKVNVVRSPPFSTYDNVGGF